MCSASAMSSNPTTATSTPLSAALRERVHHSDGDDVVEARTAVGGSGRASAWARRRESAGLGGRRFDHRLLVPERKPGTPEGVLEALRAFPTRAHARKTAQKGETPVPEPHEVLHRASAASTIVGHDGGHRGTGHAAHRENHRDPRVISRRASASVRPRGHTMMPVAPCSRIDRNTCTCGRVLTRVGDERNVIRPWGAFDADGKLGEERIHQVVDDRPDDVGAGSPQVRRTTVVDIAELADRGFDPRASPPSRGAIRTPRGKRSTLIRPPSARYPRWSLGAHAICLVGYRNVPN